MKEKEQNQRGNALPWFLVGLLVAFIVTGLASGWFNLPSANAGAQIVPTAYVIPTATAAPQVVVQAEANPVAAQDTMAVAGAESSSSTGQTGGESDSGALSNTDGNYAGDTIGGDQNITYNINSASADTAALLAQTTEVEANANGDQGTALTPCTGMNTVGQGQVLYMVKEFESMTQPIDPRTPAEEFRLNGSFCW